MSKKSLLNQFIHTEWKSLWRLTALHQFFRSHSERQTQKYAILNNDSFFWNYLLVHHFEHKNFYALRHFDICVSRILLLKRIFSLSIRSSLRTDRVSKNLRQTFNFYSDHFRKNSAAKMTSPENSEILNLLNKTLRKRSTWALFMSLWRINSQSSFEFQNINAAYNVLKIYSVISS